MSSNNLFGQILSLMLSIHTIRTSYISNSSSALTTSQLRRFGHSGSHRLWRLGVKSSRMQSLIDAGHVIEASHLAEDIMVSISPFPDDSDIRIVFRYVKQSLARYVPLIGGKYDTVKFQAGLSIYCSLLQKLCIKDHSHDPEIRLSHRIRLQELIISMLRGIDKRVSRSFHGYHDKYKELQQITGKIDEVYVRLLDPVPCRWMRLMEDAATLQHMQPRNDEGVAMDTYYNQMIDRLYSKAMKLFLQETRSLRRTSKLDNAAYMQMFDKFSWIADQLPVPTALEYCVSLSRKAEEETDVGRFHHFTKSFYYDCLSGIRGFA